MIVSFDLDETLFVNPEAVSTEPAPKFPLDLVYRDRLRKGAPALLQWLNTSGIELGIYTTSNRTERYIRGYFKYYGVRIDSIVNAKRHDAEVQRGRKEPLPSKYPAFYHIDLHVDDEKNVWQNGIAYGFRVYLLHDEDPQWTDKLRREITRIRTISSGS